MTPETVDRTIGVSCYMTQDTPTPQRTKGISAMLYEADSSEGEGGDENENDESEGMGVGGLETQPLHRFDRGDNMSIESPMKEGAASMDVDSQPESIPLETQPLYRFGVGESTATEEGPASACIDNQPESIPLETQPFHRYGVGDSVLGREVADVTIVTHLRYSPGSQCKKTPASNPSTGSKKTDYAVESKVVNAEMQSTEITNTEEDSKMEGSSNIETQDPASVPNILSSVGERNGIQSASVERGKRNQVTEGDGRKDTEHTLKPSGGRLSLSSIYGKRKSSQVGSPKETKKKVKAKIKKKKGAFDISSWLRE